MCTKSRSSIRLIRPFGLWSTAGWTISSPTIACTRRSQARPPDGATGVLICREQAIELSIQVIVVRVVGVPRVSAEIFPEHLRCCGFALDQPAGAPAFAGSDPYAF